MSTDILTGINTRVTPQREPATPEQVKNSAGGYAFAVSDIERLRRFLILGTDTGTYYISAKDLTKENAAIVIRMAETMPDILLSTILYVSFRGAAPKQNATLFAYAIACSFGPAEAKAKALSHLTDICRIGTHLFIFARYIEQFRGWGRGLRRAVGEWYTSKNPDQLAYQVTKYRQREGWSHRDMLRLSHPITQSAELKSTFDWITKGNVDGEINGLIRAFLAVNEPGRTDEEIAGWIRSFSAKRSISWEMLPDHALGSTKVWDALLENGMPMTALIRQLPRLTRLGMLPQIGGWTNDIVDQLTDMESLQKARIHPMNVLIAQRTYTSGKSEKGSSTWTPTTKIVDALDASFYKAFGNVEPAGKRTLLALDVSGSMGRENTSLPITAREASAAMSLITMATEPDYQVVGFTSTDNGWSRGTAISELSLSPRQRLDDAIRAISGLPFGNTDCALPMTWATENRLAFDTFVVYTDNETWHGSIHPHQALQKYRAASGIPAKLIVAGMASNGFSIADPNDPGMLDVVGLDAAVPQLISQFSKGL